MWWVCDSSDPTIRASRQSKERLDAGTESSQLPREEQAHVCRNTALSAGANPPKIPALLCASLILVVYEYIHYPILGHVSQPVLLRGVRRDDHGQAFPPPRLTSSCHLVLVTDFETRYRGATRKPLTAKVGRYVRVYMCTVPTDAVPNNYHTTGYQMQQTTSSVSSFSSFVHVSCKDLYASSRICCRPRTKAEVATARPVID